MTDLLITCQCDGTIRFSPGILGKAFVNSKVTSLNPLDDEFHFDLYEKEVGNRVIRASHTYAKSHCILQRHQAHVYVRSLGHVGELCI